MDLPRLLERFVSGCKWIAQPSVKTRSDLHRYVAATTVVAISVALSIDIGFRLILFTTWSATLTSWAITVFTATVVAVPILWAIGKAQLELWEAKRHVDELSRTDPLTGLLNRRCLFDEELAPENPGMSLVIVDIDHFKSVNDSYGHRAGDQVLRTVAQIMASELNDWGRLCRMGGEEFALLTEDIPPELLVRRLSRLCHRLSSIPLVVEGRAVRLTVSIGAAIRQHRSLDELYIEADRALYAAKQGGRNRVCVSPDLNRLLPPELAMPAPSALAGTCRQ